MTTSAHDMRTAVADAVNLVNSHAGQICVRLRFRDEPASEDLVANSAVLDGEQFSFTAGFDTYSGLVKDLAAIEAQLISATPQGTC